MLVLLLVSVVCQSARPAGIRDQMSPQAWTLIAKLLPEIRLARQLVIAPIFLRILCVLQKQTKTVTNVPEYVLPRGLLNVTWPAAKHTLFVSQCHSRPTWLTIVRLPSADRPLGGLLKGLGATQTITATWRAGHSTTSFASAFSRPRNSVLPSLKHLACSVLTLVCRYAGGSC